MLLQAAVRIFVFLLKINLRSALLQQLRLPTEGCVYLSYNCFAGNEKPTAVITAKVS